MTTNARLIENLKPEQMRTGWQHIRRMARVLAP